MKREWTKLAFVVCWCLCLMACATTLAPNYDKAIVDGLNVTSAQLMELFAESASGTNPASFSAREKTYNKLIGKLDAMAIQSRARPVPTNKVTDKVNAALEQRGVRLIDGSDVPSATAMEKISATLVKMRDTDQKQGVTPFEVKAFRGQVVIYLDQAITYESFLER